MNRFLQTLWVYVVINFVSFALGALSYVAYGQNAPIGYGAPSAVLETGRVLKPGAGQLSSFQVNNDATGAVIVMLFDATAIPADGAVVPVKWWPLAASTVLSVSYADAPLLLTTGITLVCSTPSTAFFTKTATAHCLFSGEVR